LPGKLWKCPGSVTVWPCVPKAEPVNDELTEPAGVTEVPLNDAVWLCVANALPVKLELTEPAGVTDVPVNDELTEPAGVTDVPVNDDETLPAGVTDVPLNDAVWLCVANALPVKLDDAVCVWLTNTAFALPPVAPTA
jgi:hypothetical protein